MVATMFLWRKLTVTALFLLSCTVFGVPVDAKTAQEILAKHGLPPGLLPDEVSDYSLLGNGHFKVKMQGRCYVALGPDKDEVCYDSVITGILKDGSLSNLSGITTRKVFLWLKVTTIYVDKPGSGWIHFQVGFVSKSMRLSVFDHPPVCGPVHNGWALLLPPWTEVPRRREGVLSEEDKAGMEER